MTRSFFLSLLTILASQVFASCFSQSEYATDAPMQEAQEQRQDGPSRAERLRRWEKGFVYVTKVIDGDTFWVDNGSEEFKVRFIGIDAPETRNSRWKQKGYFAQEAKVFVQQQTERKWVRLEMDVQATDRYRRRLAYIFLEDGTFLNAKLVEQGYAVQDTYPPNVKYVELFTALQAKARERQLGLWGEDIEE